MKSERQRELESIVRVATDAVRETVAPTAPVICECIFFGAMAIHPRHLAIWYVFETDASLSAAERSGLTEEIIQCTRGELARCGYPPEVVRLIRARFTSKETVEREAGGDYFRYFK